MEEELNQKIERSGEDFFHASLQASFMTRPDLSDIKPAELASLSASSSGDPRQQRPDFKIKTGNAKPQARAGKSKSVAKEPSKSMLPKPAEPSAWVKKMEDMRARMDNMKKELEELQSGKWKEDFAFPDCVEEFDDELENLE